MRQQIFVLIAMLAFASCGFSQGRQNSLSTPAHPTPQVFINQFCTKCHNSQLKTAGLSLDNENVSEIGKNGAVWEKVLQKLHAEAMPPAGLPRPDAAAYRSMIEYLENSLDAVWAANPNPGRPGIHRLNRIEYAHSVRDLLAVEIDAKAMLPADDSSYGFDNIGDVLTVSPLLMERYLAAARAISRIAIGSMETQPAEITYQVPRYYIQDDRPGEDTPFGSRGGISITHNFPLDAEYSIRLRLKRSYDGSVILGLLTKPHRIEITIDSALVKTLTAGGPDVYLGPTLQPSAAGAGNNTYANVAPPADEGLNFRIPVSAGPHRVSVSFPREYVSKPEGILRARGADLSDDLSLGSLIIGGPYNPQGVGKSPSRERVFSCHPARDQEAESCANQIISGLARRAFRRPVNKDDLAPLLATFRAGAQAGGFEKGIEIALRSVLASPEFLFRIEMDPAAGPPDKPYRLTPVELASRLSFFLWSSLPDEELLREAESGRLTSPAVLQRQVTRMLADRRSSALVANFAGQWLYLRNIEKSVPDPKEFPEFDENLREALQRETELFFSSMLRENRSLLDLLSADYTFVNERLARHYGIENVYGSHFRKVRLADANRFGLLGQGAILTVTSYPNRTSPTLRGKWILENLLGSPPPPPPPNVPSLQDRGADGKVVSMRQQMEKHRANSACASCHARMDPLGFALENFDALGKWRTVSGGAQVPIDASGALPDGAKFNGPAELRQILLKRGDSFARVVAERLFTYALGRGVEYYDGLAIRKALRAAAKDGYRWHTLISEVVRSAPFQMRRSRTQ
ncbi:MAG: DUF1592 domain-containing protein [Acidobacteria bacterium]|nr:DUF1592 domain-containing protein [Acidobacteriota bacterium]